MKLLLAILSVVLFSLADKPLHLKGRGYEGYIFDEMDFPLSDTRYAPTATDVLTAEQLLRSQLPELNKKHINQVDNLPIIDKKLRKYTRQYVGFINDKGEKCLWINFVWDTQHDMKAELAQRIISVSDGGSYYWNVKVNITTQNVYDLAVNGLG